MLQKYLKFALGDSLRSCSAADIPAPELWIGERIPFASMTTVSNRSDAIEFDVTTIAAVSD